MTDADAVATERRHPHADVGVPAPVDPGDVLGRRLARRARPQRCARRRRRRPPRPRRRSRSRSTATCGRCAAARDGIEVVPGRPRRRCRSRSTATRSPTSSCERAHRARARDRRARRRRPRGERGVLRVGSRAALRARRARRVPARRRRRCAALDGAPLDLDQRFRLGERPAEAAHFLAEAGFLLLHGRVHRRRDGRGRRRPRPGRRRRRARRRRRRGGPRRAPGERYPCRILDFARQSRGAARRCSTTPRFLAIGELLGDGHRPGDPFGEHFAEVTAEGLVKRVESVEGLACLPWHKDCDRGGHSMFCSGLTIGICLTPVDDAHGGLDVIAGSHRANIARAQVDRGARPPERHAAGRPRRPHRAPVVRAAPVDPSRRAASGASPTPASRCRRARATGTARRTTQPRLARERAAHRRPEPRGARARRRAGASGDDDGLGGHRRGRRDGRGVRARARARRRRAAAHRRRRTTGSTRSASEIARATTGARSCTLAGDLGDPAFVADLAARAARARRRCTRWCTPPGCRRRWRAGARSCASTWSAVGAAARRVPAARSVPGSVGGVPRVDRRATWARSIRRWTRCSTTRSRADLDARFRAAFGDEPDPGSTYRLAKRGVIRLCERAAVAWGARGGRVVSLSPGLIDTEMGRLELVHNPIKVQMAEMTPVGAGRSPDATPCCPAAPTTSRTRSRSSARTRAAFVSGCDLRVDGGLVAAMNQPDDR